MARNPGVCRYEDCRAIGQPRQLSYPPLGSEPRWPHAPIEICGAHCPEVRARITDRTHWLAVLRDGSLWFDALDAVS